MFIREQMIQWREIRQEFLDNEALDRWVWSPESCRHTCWTFRPNNYGRLLWGF